MENQKWETKKRKLFSALLIILFVAPLFSLGAGLVPCEGPNCTICHLFELIKNVVDFVLFKIVTPIAVLFIVIGGGLIIFGAENPQNIDKGKTVLLYTIVGLLLIFGAWLLVNTFFTIVGVQTWTGLKNWWEIKCEAVPVTPSPTPTTGPTTPTPTPTPSKYSCNEDEGKCYADPGGPYATENECKQNCKLYHWEWARRDLGELCSNGQAPADNSKCKGTPNAATDPLSAKCSELPRDQVPVWCTAICCEGAAAPPPPPPSEDIFATDKEGYDYLLNNGVDVAADWCNNDNCNNMTGCTCLKGLPISMADKLIALRKASDATVVVTGGTEDGHITHASGEPIVDLRSQNEGTELTNWIYENGQLNGSGCKGYYGMTCYSWNGLQFYKESDHWHTEGY